MNGGVQSVESQRIKWLVLLAFIFVVPFNYEFQIHPLFGFLAALLVSWLVVEDFFDMLIDLRITGTLLLLVLLWNQLKGTAHLFQAVCTFLGFALGFYIVRTLFTRFVPADETSGEEASTHDNIDSLQEGANVGLMPLMGLAVFLVLSVDMVFNPVYILSGLAENGVGWAGILLQCHFTVVQLGILLGANWDKLLLFLGLMALILALLAWNVRRKIRQNQLPYYPCGAGDPLVVGVFAAMVGAECFYFGVMILTLVFGIMVHVCKYYHLIKGRRI